MRITALAQRLVVAGILSHAQAVKLQPSNGAKNINADTLLSITFDSTPGIGESGFVKVYDVEQNKLVDSLNLSIPFSPNPDGGYGNTIDAPEYQKNIVGGMDFYYFPIIVNGDTATIYLHNGRLEYGKSYRVEIDSEVLQPANGTFDGFYPDDPWTFSTKADGPSKDSTSVAVAADGSADFDTIQGAIDWAPGNPTQRIEISIGPGNYTELIFFRYKSSLVLRGAGQNKTVVAYPNNAAFNPPRTQGPSRRPAFSFYSVDDIQLSSFTIRNIFSGQAEALLAEGNRVILDHMRLIGSGDAFTTYGTIYVADTILIGDWMDTLLGYASMYWLRSTITSPGSLIWARTVQGIHGNAFVNCTMIADDATLGRLPQNTGGVLDNWPYSEIVLINTKTDGIDPIGWKQIPGPPFDTSHIHYWEYNTMDLDGNPVDTSGRVNVSRTLRLPKDAQVIKDYSDPAFVLGGWTPVIISALAHRDRRPV